MGKKSELGSMLSILSMGNTAEKTGPEAMTSEVIDIPSPSELASKRSELMKLVDPEDIDPTDRKMVDNYFKEVIDNVGAIIDDDDLVTDISGFTDLALDSFGDFDADFNLKNDLISGGRKYARATSTGGEDSEVNRAFAAQYAALNDLLRAIDADKKELDKDIHHIRGLRNRNYKALADLGAVKATLHGQTLSAIKELNAMAKTQFDIKNKMNAGEAGDADAASARAMQSIFGMGRKALVESNGGISSIAGYSEEEHSNNVSIENTMLMDDDALVERFGGVGNADGDKFTKYEKLGVEYVVEFDEDGSYNIFAEDKDGNVVEDYPLPEGDGLKFEINQRTNTATDQLQRRYKVRNVE